MEKIEDLTPGLPCGGLPLASLRGHVGLPDTGRGTCGYLKTCAVLGGLKHATRKDLSPRRPLRSTKLIRRFLRGTSCSLW